MFVLVKFASNQLLILSNWEDFSSSTVILYIFISPSHLYLPLLVVVEVYLSDMVIRLVDDDFDIGNLFGLVKDVAVCEIIFSCLACFTIIESKAKCKDIIPLHLCDWQLSELL